MHHVTGYWQTVRLFNRDVRLYLVTAAMMGLTLFGGTYSLLLNLYLLRLGYGPEFIGLLHGSGTLAWAAGCLPAGALGQRMGSRRALIAGMGIAALGYILLPFAGWVLGAWQPAWLVGCYLWGNFIIALYDVNSAPFIMDVTHAGERDHVFSVQGALWPLAGFAGSLVGGVLPALTGLLIGLPTDDSLTYAYPLIVSAMFLLFGAYAVSRTRPQPKPAAAAAEAGGSTKARWRGLLMAAPLAVIGFLGLVVMLTGTSEGAARSFFNVYMDDGLGVATPQIGTLAAVAQLVGVGGALAMPLVSKRLGHRYTFIWGTLGMAAALLPLAFVPNWVAAGFGYIVMMALASLVRPALTVYLMNAVTQQWRPMMSAVTTMGLALSWSAISAGGGYIITAFGYPAFFLVAAAVTAFGVVVFAARHEAQPVAEAA
jgi:MFS family permease